MFFKPEDYTTYRQPLPDSRWLRPDKFQEILSSYQKSSHFELKLLGKSFEGRPIKSLSWGRGSTRVLLWTQMHGNEPTATLACLDLWRFLKMSDEYDPLRNLWRDKLQLLFIPQLNPDGVERFSRRNAQQIDINRDALAQQSPEMKLFQGQLSDFEPQWCFNLHDQRSIFSVGKEANPATISFLAPSADESRALTPVREQCMKLISRMAELTESEIPGHTGRYSDEFYPLALGDNLHRQNIPCVLIEAGAYYNDPERNMARKLNFLCLMRAFQSLATNDWQEASQEAYQQIPANEQGRRDLIIRNCWFQHAEAGKSYVDLGLSIRESVNKGKLEKHWLLSEVGDLQHLLGFEEVEGGQISDYQSIKLDAPANFSLLGKKQIEFKKGLWLI